jgi:hypothetical protein
VQALNTGLDPVMTTPVAPLAFWKVKPSMRVAAVSPVTHRTMLDPADGGMT